MRGPGLFCLLLSIAILLNALTCSADPILTSSTVLNPGVNVFSLNVSSLIRSYNVYVPTIYFPSSAPVSVIISLHGLGLPCTNFGPWTGFSPIADQFGFLHVYPCGLTGPRGVSWNAGRCCINNAQGRPVDDVRFIIEMTNSLISSLNVNKNEIFVAGFSNGGFLTERLACEASGIFRGFASISGVVVEMPGWLGGLKTCDSLFSAVGIPAPILHVHGLADSLVPFNGNELAGFPPVLNDTLAWAVRNGCSGSGFNTFRNGPYFNNVWNNCHSGGYVELVTVIGGQHRWYRDSLFDTTNYIWQFFQNIINGTEIIQNDDRDDLQNS